MNSAMNPSTNRWTPAPGTSADGIQSKAERSWANLFALFFVTARQDKALHPFQRSLEFVLLDRSRRVNMLRTNARTFPDKRASPNALRMSQQAEPLLCTLIAVVQVVALRQRNRSRPH